MNFDLGELTDFLTFEQKFTKLHKYENCPVCGKEFRNNGLATQLVRCIINYKYIGIITNNPIMIKILKIQGFSISQDKKNIRIYLRVMNLEE